MLKKRFEKKEDLKAIIDMDDFLVTYGAQVLGEERSDLTQTIYNACQNNLRGLDSLFKDKGFGRIHKFQEIAQGYVSDMYELDGNEAASKVNEIIHRAVAYMGSHANDFNKWKLA